MFPIMQKILVKIRDNKIFTVFVAEQSDNKFQPQF